MERLINLLVAGFCGFAGLQEYYGTWLDDMSIIFAIVNLALFLRPLGDCKD